MSYPIATELSYEVLQRQRREAQVVLSPANQALVIRQSRLNPEELFSADEIVRSEEVIPTWAWHGRSRHGR